MREISFGDSGPGVTSNSQAELSLEPPAFAPASDDLGLTLARDPAEPPPRRRKPLPRRPLILAVWAVVLGVALSVAYVTQPARQLNSDTDLPPAVAPTPADELGAPVTAPPIAAEPERFAQAASAPEINPPAAVDEPQPGDLKVAEATPPPAETATTAATPSAPQPLVAKPAPITTAAVDKPKTIAKLERVTAAPKAEVTARTGAKPPKAEKVAKADDKTKVASAKNLPLLKARLDHAYAEAVKAGTPKTVLKARQAEWLVLRAKAERKGPAAVAALYRTRAAQLEAIAKKTARTRSKAEAAPV
jgi:hypothetical protein